ncbi:MAG: carboxymuconolactone decarboxylase family protein [Erythrobacter sp.]|uniref:carboxymuconolactone decarboxylase family protein n=1 Tax=Erythrobacter sp. TaxID=1042 RepID=UPI00260FAA9A|nr:carboxymuconolactone decarboxylase family protein [Erythrobacter sp.]MDJ0979706.1 carboxymuconolactone decarboxylase family protein [Erythrobacter sp.]
MELTPEQEQFKADYIRSRGYWVPFNDGLLAYAPDYLKQYLAYASVPAETGPLSAKDRELIYVAVDTSTTHMFGQGLAIHVRAALKAGCTPHELIEVMEIATAQGLDSVSVGIGVVVDELAAAGKVGDTDTRALTTDETEAKAEFSEKYGSWPNWAEQLLRRDLAYFRAMTAIMDGPSLTGALDQRSRALVRFALAASPTHMSQEMMREHARTAIALGISGEELIEVLQLVAHLGVHACVIGVPEIVEAVGEP